MPSCSLCCSRCPCFDLSVQQNNNAANNDNNVNYNNMTCFSLLLQRIKRIYTSCQMYIIILYFVFVKPIITLLTCWTAFIVIYSWYILIVPIWYLINDDLFKSGILCPFGYSTCNQSNNCHCNGLQVTNSLVFPILVLGILAVPLAFRINNYSAQLSKLVTYYCLTDHYKYVDNNQNDNQQLLYENNV